VESLALALVDPEPEVRKEVARTLGKIGTRAQAAVLALTLALKDREGKVNWAAAEALAKIGPAAREAIPALVEMLDPDEEPELAARALAAVDRDGIAVVELLLKMLPELPRRSPQWRWSIFSALGHFSARSPEAARALLQLTRDDDPG